MYKVGQLIVYGGEGVCRVEAVGVPETNAASANKLYYTLAPLYRAGRVFIPVDGNVFTRPVITREEAISVIRLMPTTEGFACLERNLRFLTEHYQRCLQQHDCIETVKLIKSIYQKRKLAEEKGKKLGQIDERFMKRAEDMLYGELAVALDIPRSGVVEYITCAIDLINAGAEWNG